MKIMKLVVSLGAAVAMAKVAKVITKVSVDDVLDYVGLERRRSHALENLVIFGAGALAGAGAGLLLAPAPGRETRDKIGRGIDKLATKATDALEQAGHVTGQRTMVPSDLQRGNGGPDGR